MNLKNGQQIKQINLNFLSITYLQTQLKRGKQICFGFSAFFGQQKPKKNKKMGANEARISNATDEIVEFIFSSNQLSAIERKQTQNWESKLNLKGDLKQKTVGGGMDLDHKHEIVTVQKKENKIHKFCLGPKQTEQIPLVQKVNYYTIIVADKVVRENVPIKEKNFRRVIYRMDNNYYVGVLQDNQNWRMKESGSAEKRNYPPGMKCEYCGEEKTCKISMFGVEGKLFYFPDIKEIREGKLVRPCMRENYERIL